jgi:hypothetical protein
MGLIYMLMALIAILAMAGGVVGYLSLVMPMPTTRIGWLEQYMNVLLILSIISALMLVNAGPY